MTPASTKMMTSSVTPRRGTGWEVRVGRGEGRTR